MEELNIFNEENNLINSNKQLLIQHCSIKYLNILFWFVILFDIVLALLGIFFNALLVPAALHARPIPFRTRRFLSSITLNYALLSSILLTKKCFWLYFSLFNPNGQCIPTFTFTTCKLQEFPLIFIYIYSIGLPLIFVLQMAFNRWFKKNRKLNYYQKEIVLQNSQSRRVKKLIINENNNHYRYSNISEEELKKWRIKQPKPLPLPYWLCSTKQIILIVLCFGIALFFTIFDKWDDGHLKQRKMVNCSIILAIRQKSLVFGFLSLILIVQLLQSLLWYFIPLKSIKKSKKMSCRHSSIFNFLVFSCRDLFLLEALGWGLVALLTGLALFQKYVLNSPCNKCTQLAIELPFTTLPLLISLLHPILELILITPIRYSTQHFFPLFSKLLPTQEPVTPPLPRTFPSVRILITEH